MNFKHLFSRYLDASLRREHRTLLSILTWGLCPLSFFYGLGIRVRNSLYSLGVKQSYRSKLPVISVGNITLGGTGKTPMVDFISHFFQSKGVKCAIVSRGYSGTYQQPFGCVRDRQGHFLMTVEECGDEPFLLAQKNPGTAVYVARKRQLGVQAAEREGAQVVILDDAFQHLAIQRDLNILLLDAKYPFGNGHLLPAGNLREPKRALNRADLIILSRAKDQLDNLGGVSSAPVIKSSHIPDTVLKYLEGNPVDQAVYSGKNCLAFAGIARPDEFFSALNQFGFRQVDHISLLDHQSYGTETLALINSQIKNHDLLVTTEKDAVKLDKATFSIPCLVLEVKLSFENQPLLEKFLGSVLQNQKHGSDQ